MSIDLVPQHFHGMFDINELKDMEACIKKRDEIYNCQKNSLLQINQTQDLSEINNLYSAIDDDNEILVLLAEKISALNFGENQHKRPFPCFSLFE